MLSPYRIPSNTHKRIRNISNTNLDDDSHRKHDLRRPRITANDKRFQIKSKEHIIKERSKIKGGDPSDGSVLMAQVSSDTMN